MNMQADIKAQRTISRIWRGQMIAPVCDGVRARAAALSQSSSSSKPSHQWPICISRHLGSIAASSTVNGWETISLPQALQTTINALPIRPTM